MREYPVMVEKQEKSQNDEGLFVRYGYVPISCDLHQWRLSSKADFRKEDARVVSLSDYLKVVGATVHSGSFCGIVEFQKKKNKKWIMRVPNYFPETDHDKGSDLEVDVMKQLKESINGLDDLCEEITALQNQVGALDNFDNNGCPNDLYSYSNLFVNRNIVHAAWNYLSNLKEKLSPHFIPYLDKLIQGSEIIGMYGKYEFNPTIPVQMRFTASNEKYMYLQEGIGKWDNPEEKLCTYEEWMERFSPSSDKSLPDRYYVSNDLQLILAIIEVLCLHRVQLKRCENRNCNDIFILVDGREKYCPDCKMEMKKRKSREYKTGENKDEYNFKQRVFSRFKRCNNQGKKFNIDCLNLDDVDPALVQRIEKAIDEKSYTQFRKAINKIIKVQKDRAVSKYDKYTVDKYQQWLDTCFASIKTSMI